jgi:hypothetical protein
MEDITMGVDTTVGGTTTTDTTGENAGLATVG